MAIGSNPEIGTRFGLLKDMTDADLDAWFEYMRTAWQPNLLAGYATVVHKTDNPYYRKRNQ